jgi:predicted nucleic acid-binding protein
VLVVDANVLLHAVNTASPHHARARERLAQWSAVPGQIGLTWSIVYEFLRVATHPAVFPKPLRFADAWSFVDALLSQARARGGGGPPHPPPPPPPPCCTSGAPDL